MSLYKSVGVYAFANAIIALAAIFLTVILGRQLGVDGFGTLASFIALQNIWASLGFMRVDTRIANSASGIEADKILLAGFFAGGLVSLALALIASLIWGWSSQFPLVFVSGFSLSVLDALALRHAFGKRERGVAIARAARIVGPLSLSVLVSGHTSQPEVVFQWQSMGMLVLSLVLWRRWIGLVRWYRVCGSVLLRHRRGLMPSLAFCLLNGLWLNGLTPLLNLYSSPAQAGQFAMLQRILGGSLGLVSTATTMVFARLEHVHAGLVWVLRIFLANLACSIGICLLASIFIFGGWLTLLLGNVWIYEVDLFISVSLFLTLSYSVGALSMLATRLVDEWFLAIWQAGALLIWVVLFTLLPSGSNLLFALNFGALLYVVLGMRWYHLLQKK
jgi:hypothetical protein